jgi:hypothetical protein
LFAGKRLPRGTDELGFPVAGTARLINRPASKTLILSSIASRPVASLNKVCEAGFYCAPSEKFDSCCFDDEFNEYQDRILIFMV